MTTIATYLVSAGHLRREADLHDELAARLSGFATRAREFHSGPFLEPLDDSMTRAVANLVLAGTALRDVSTECQARVELIIEHKASVARWETAFEHVPPYSRPLRPQWRHDWTFQ